MKEPAPFLEPVKFAKFIAHTFEAFDPLGAAAVGHPLQSQHTKRNANDTDPCIDKEQQKSCSE
jgi:hypothetical protein